MDSGQKVPVKIASMAGEAGKLDHNSKYDVSL